jgi:6-phosphogluconolactonase (cycloisomerase 2 family)
MAKTVLYSSIGPELAAYDIDVDQATLTRRGAVTLPANVQYGWPHPSRRFLYVASSSGGPGASGDTHHLSAFRIDAGSGALTPHGAPQRLGSRPVHMSIDRTGKHALTAYNIPSAISVHRIEADGTVGAMVQQPGILDTGIFAHQVVTTPGDRAAIMVTRGNDAANGKPEDPGALKVYGFADGRLSNMVSIAPGGGLGFGPRHVDFHPTLPLVYAAIERQNQLHVYALAANGGLGLKPTHVLSTLAEPNAMRGRQLVGAVRVHPNGRFVYVSNRGGSTSTMDSQSVADGEDSIAVFALDADGTPRLVQNADAEGVHTRTFSIDPSGRLLVAASILPQSRRVGGAVRQVPAGLAVFRVGPDGKLAYQRRYDLDTGKLMQFWSGMVTLP